MVPMASPPSHVFSETEPYGPSEQLRSCSYFRHTRHDIIVGMRDCGHARGGRSDHRDDKGDETVTKVADMDEGFWRERAEEARRIAKGLSTTWARNDLLAIAQRYERMANTARERKQSIGQWLRRGGRFIRVH
jgi:hypothetical protein